MIYPYIVRWKNKKTGKRYVIVDTAIDKTNERSGLKVIIYRHEDGNGIFVRELNEFYEKFERIWQ